MWAPCGTTCITLPLTSKGVLSFVNREPIIEFDLHLHGNKRNERNEMYRRRLTDEVGTVAFPFVGCKNPFLTSKNLVAIYFITN